MKRLIIFFAVIFVAACVNEEAPNPSPDFNPKNEEIAPQSEKLFFHKKTNRYIYERGDPYTLKNVRKAYAWLCKHLAQQEKTRAELEIALSNGEPQATHYHMKFYPRNEGEQWRIELMEDIAVSYIPFDYTEATEEQIENAEITRSEIQEFEEETRYSVTYNNVTSAEGAVIPSVTYEMPVLYVVWPLEKELPADLEYEIIEELYIPNTATAENAEFEEMLETAAIIISPGITPPEVPDEPILIVDTYSIYGKILAFDSKMGTYIPVPGLTIRSANGSRVWETTTDENGDFTLTTIMGSIYSVFFKNSKWKITEINSTTPIIQAFSHVIINTTRRQEFSFDQETRYFEATRALYYFYHGDHPIYPWSYNENGGNIRIEMSNEEKLTYINSKNEVDSAWGLFWAPYQDNYAYIQVANHTQYDDSYLIGTLLHEMGHFCHFKERGGTSEVSQAVDTLIEESYASYIGWSLVTRYYYTLGCISDYLKERVSVQHRQYWDATDYSSPYSPLFIDLFDTYNQSIVSSTYINENLSGFSHEVMREIAKECTTWESCRSKLLEYVDIYYTSAQIIPYLAVYDNWDLNKI